MAPRFRERWCEQMAAQLPTFAFRGVHPPVHRHVPPRPTTKVEPFGGLETEVLWQLQAVKPGLPVQWLGNTYEQDESPTIDPATDPSVGIWQLLNGIAVSGEVSSPDGPVDDATVRVYAGRQLVQTNTNVDGQSMLWAFLLVM